MTPIEVPFSAEGSINLSTGAITLGEKPKIIRPSLEDFRIPTEEPIRSTEKIVHDHAFGVRRALWGVVNAEDGLETIAMADFLKGLSDEERKILYEDLFLEGVSFEWLMCVRPSKVEEVIKMMKEMMQETERQNPGFYKRRRALEDLLNESIGNRWQHRNNARFVRENPSAVHTDEVGGKTIRNDEKYYRKLLERDNGSGII